MSDDNTSVTPTLVSTVELKEVSNPSSTSSGSSNFANSKSDEKAKKSDPWEENKLKDWEDSKLKDLLEEAYSYKNPRDKENKSAAFLQLLQKAENEKEESTFSFSALTHRYSSRGSSSNNSHTQGGSLQDLVEAVRNESILDCEYPCTTRNRRHNHNSRPKKFSSVSSRQREGGSLPSNVNVSNCCLSVYDQQPFLNEVSKQRRNKNERTCSGTSCASVASATSSTVSTGGRDSLNSSCKEDSSSFAGTNCSAPLNSGDTVIDMDGIDEAAHILAHDSLSQGLNDTMVSDDGIEMGCMKKFPRAALNVTTQGKVDCAYVEPKHYVDDSVTFTTLERGKNSVESSYLPLDGNYKSCKSILGEKSDLVKPQTSLFSSTKTISFDENGNALNSTFNTSQSQAKAKKKKTQSERNTKTLIAESVAGYRGKDPLEELVKYIENTEDTKSNDKVSKFAEHKKKEKKKEKNKIKKSNSLEELRSCTKLDEDAEPVTMRNKGKNGGKNSAAAQGGQSNTVNAINDSKDNGNGKQTSANNSRKSERRSWGTEELSYLGESQNSQIEEAREKVKEKEKRKSKESIDNSKVGAGERSDKKTKKDEQQLMTSLKVVSMESIQMESAEFHVVTKKKKPKKRQNLDETARANSFGNTTQKGRDFNQSRKYQASSNFTNDRDAYMTTFSTSDKSRRKSTSSVPPSEKSDSSDLDSVHSLPVESTNRHKSKNPTQANSNNNNAHQPQSYADIARTVNRFSAFDKLEKSPSDDGSESTTSTKKSKKSPRPEFPDLGGYDKGANFNNDAASSCSSTSSNSTIVKQISYSQSLATAPGTNTDDENKKSPIIASLSAPSAEVARQTLQKSKSMDNENYCNSMDQYPALEKTVKKHAMASTSTDITSTSISAITTTTISGIKSHSPTPSPPNDTTKSKVNNSSANVVDLSLSNISFISSTSSPSDSSNISSHFSNNFIAKKSTKNSNFNSNSNHQQFNAKANECSNHLVAPSKLTATIITPHSESISKNLQDESNSIGLSVSVTTATGRKTSKKDKQQIIESSKRSTNSSNNSAKQTNRPAVIILNDETAAGRLLTSDFTFGDFNEDELRFFEEDNPVRSTTPTQQLAAVASPTEDSAGDFNLTELSQDASSITEENYINISPNSTHDHGYISASNQSIDGQQSSSTPASGKQQSQYKSHQKIQSINSTITSRPNQSSNLVSENQNNNSTIKAEIASSSSVASGPDFINNNVFTHTINQARMEQLAKAQQQQKSSSFSRSTSASAAATAESISQSLHYLDSKLINKNPPPLGATIVTCDEIESSLTAAKRISVRNSELNHTPEDGVKSVAGITTVTVASKTQRKEIDINFIPPIITTPINNDRIIDFIGSAWEEVTNSKVTQFYDGQ